MASESAKQIAEALNVKRIIPGGGYRPGPYTTVLNWGSSSMHFSHTNVLNKPEAVAIAANKLSTLKRLKEQGVATVDFTSSKATVQGWLNLGSKVVVRHRLSDNSGGGIEILRPGAYEISDAPLYTKYLKKEREFRVHVFKGNVFDVQEKKKKSGVDFDEGADEALIRSHLNGWIFCRTGVVCPDIVKEAATASVAALGLDFGAVDVIVSKTKAYVLEVNTAPGMENTTLQKYIEQFQPYNTRPTRRRRRTNSNYAQPTSRRSRNVYAW